MTLQTQSDSIKVKRLPNVPTNIDILQLEANSNEITGDQGVFEIPLQTETAKGEYSIFIFTQSSWFELVRQSPEWLRTTFAYKKPDGFTILGRRNISISTTQRTASPKLVFAGNPAILDIEPANRFPYFEMQLAQGLLKHLWSQPLKQGPTSLAYGDFLKLSLANKLGRLREGDFAIMCQGMRDLFLHATEGVPGLRARAVDAFNYDTGEGFSDLISYSHATAEIYVKSLDKWVLFDPWLGFAIVNKDSVPVSAEELKLGQAIAANLQLVPLLTEIPRHHKNSDGEIVSSNYRPSETKLQKFTCRKLGCTPGYLEYFKSITYRKHAIRPMPSEE